MGFHETGNFSNADVKGEAFLFLYDSIPIIILFFHCKKSVHSCLLGFCTRMSEKKETPPAAAAAAAAAEEPTGLRTFEVLDEDDEFEEFAKEEWTAAEEVGDDKQDWQDNWEDEDPSDDFLTQLREELKRGDGKDEAMHA
jgi:26 proteasome complex subunit DSS1